MGHVSRGATRFLAIALLSAIFLSGCAGSPTFLAPASPNARLVLNLTNIIFWIAVVVFVVVEGMLIYAAIRFARGPEDGERSQVEGNTRLEVAWTFAPAIVLLIVFFVTLPTLLTLTRLPAQQAAAGQAPSGNALQVRVIGHQWWWEFQYPDQHIVTANEMHIPAGATVSVSVESADVIHSFWVPQLGGKIDVIPGHVNHTWFESSAPGTYEGQCSEFCGAQHAQMRLRVVVDNPDQFQVWVQGQQAPVAAKSGDASKGEQVFLAGPCIGCHAVAGTKAQGKVGPDLTHFASRKVFAGASVDNTPENLARWLADPQAIKPGNKMPNLHLPQDQINALVAYLESLK